VEPMTLYTCPVFLLITTSLFQILLSRLTRRLLSQHLSPTHRFHSYCPEIKRRIITQSAALLMKPLLLVYFLPFLRSYPHTTEPLWTTADLDALITVHASMYIFDVTHHHATLPYFAHHILVLTCGLLTRGRAPLVVLFFAPFVAGIIFGDACIETAWVTYRLSNVAAGKMMAVCAHANRAIRGFQWASVAVYLVRFWREMVDALGWKGTVALAAACAFWAWCEWFAVGLCFALGEKLELEVRTPEEKSECVYAALGKKQGGAGVRVFGRWIREHLVEFALWCVGM
jgi:hypothetical protein